MRTHTRWMPASVSIAGAADPPSRETNHGGLGLAVLALWLLSAARPAVAAEAAAAMPRVRSSDLTLTVLIDRAARGSETFRRLLTTIQASNGIVYVESGPCGHGVRACLKMWMHVSGPNRFVRISIDRSNGHSEREIMRSVGHELQHAIEVLHEPTITDGATMFNAFKRMAPTDNGRFETTAAIDVGNAVYDESARLDAPATLPGEGHGSGGMRTGNR